MSAVARLSLKGGIRTGPARRAPQSASILETARRQFNERQDVTWIDVPDLLDDLGHKYSPILIDVRGLDEFADRLGLRPGRKSWMKLSPDLPGLRSRLNVKMR